jgi:hypothetical protein
LWKNLSAPATESIRVWIPTRSGDARSFMQEVVISRILANHKLCALVQCSICVVDNDTVRQRFS